MTTSGETAPQPQPWWNVNQVVTLCASCHGIDEPLNPGVQVEDEYVFIPTNYTVTCARCGRTNAA